MKVIEHHRRSQRTTVYSALLLFNLVLVIVQLWLFVGALEGMLSGRQVMALPAAGVSVLLLVVNVWMFLGIIRLEKTSS